MKRERVRERMRTLREEAEREARARLRSFMSEASKAQDVLIRAMVHEWPAGTTDQEMRSAVEAAKEWLARALGPTGGSAAGKGTGTVQVLVANITANDYEAVTSGQRSLSSVVEVVALPAPK